MRRSAPPVPAPPPDLRRTEVDAGPFRVHALEAGRGEPVVLLHGLSGSSRWWRRNLASFAERFRVLVPDVIGFGRTRPRGPLPDVETLTGLLAEWMARVGAERAHVVGHSMGGQLALHLAAEQPERLRRLVLVDAAGIPRPLAPRALLRFAREVAAPSRWGDPVFLPVIAGDALSAGPLTLLRGLARVLRDDVRPLLGRVRAPTLIVWGERDVIVPTAHARTLRDGIEGARLEVIVGAAHNPMVDRPAVFDRIVLDFLSEDEP